MKSQKFKIYIFKSLLYLKLFKLTGTTRQTRSSRNKHVALRNGYARKLLIYRN